MSLFAHSSNFALAFALMIAAVAPAAAQQSSSFKVEGATFNAGGHPEQSAVLTGATYAITFDALGGGVSARDLASASYRSDTGLVAQNAPPGEVTGLIFTSPTTFVWDGERSTGTYAVYRGGLSPLPGGDGACLLGGLPGTAGGDIATPAIGQGFFYLVTAKNGLGEEGTKGKRSDGSWRANNSPCP